MKSAIIKVAAVAAFTVLAGCQDLKPLQADVDNLKQQVSRLSADLAAGRFHVRLAAGVSGHQHGGCECVLPRGVPRLGN